MSDRRRGQHRRCERTLTATAIGGLMVSVLAGCSSEAPVEEISPVAGAIAACLTAGQEQFDLPLTETPGVEVNVEVDDQGWWAVNATTRGDGATQALVCTAVPDSGPLGARAASFSVSEG